MAQAVDTQLAPLAKIDDYDEIRRVLQLYIDGASMGDRAKLKEAFHEDARMFGNIAGTRYDVPIQHLFQLAEDKPGNTGHYRGRIVSVGQTGDAAFGVVAEDGYWGTVSFVDYFLLARIDGQWKITCKTFAHTGGEPPKG
jgi:hypothetical protein